MKKQTTNQQLCVRVNMRAGKVCLMESPEMAACFNICGLNKMLGKINDQQLGACYGECNKLPTVQVECPPESQSPKK